jgi:hypothetical protein
MPLVRVAQYRTACRKPHRLGTRKIVVNVFKLHAKFFCNFCRAQGAALA